MGLFSRDPAKKLKKQYEALLKEARDIQRKGDIQGYALKTAEAEELWKEIEALQKK